MRRIFATIAARSLELESKAINATSRADYFEELFLQKRDEYDRLLRRKVVRVALLVAALGEAIASELTVESSGESMPMTTVTPTMYARLVIAHTTFGDGPDAHHHSMSLVKLT